MDEQHPAVRRFLKILADLQKLPEAKMLPKGFLMAIAAELARG